MTTYKNTKLRLYTFCNFYLNSISQGIQSGHVAVKMANFYRKRDGAEARMFWDWASEGMENETIVVLNGGMSADIAEAYRKFEPFLTANNLPSNIFYEEPRAFGFGDETARRAPTCWGVVLPRMLYEARLVRFAPGGRFGRDYFEYTEPVIGTEPVKTVVSVDVPGTSMTGAELFEFLQYKNSCPLAR